MSHLIKFKKDSLPMDVFVGLVIKYSKGYQIGGSTTSYQSLIQDLIFTDESTQTISATLTEGKAFGAGVTSTIVGYHMGGTGNNSPFALDEIERLTYSNETTEAITATISDLRRLMASVNSTSKGYSMGGYDHLFAPKNTIGEIVFSDESTQDLASTLNNARTQPQGVNSDTKGYAMGGSYTTSFYTWIDDLVFSSGTSTILTAALDTGTGSGASVDTDTKGYVMGGTITGGNSTNRIENLVFADESSQTISETLTYNTEATGNGVQSDISGYAMGAGDTSSRSGFIRAFTFSTETKYVCTDTLSTAVFGGTGVQSGFQ